MSLLSHRLCPLPPRQSFRRKLPLQTLFGGYVALKAMHCNICRSRAAFGSDHECKAGLLPRALSQCDGKLAQYSCCSRRHARHADISYHHSLPFRSVRVSVPAAAARLSWPNTTSKITPVSDDSKRECGSLRFTCAREGPSTLRERKAKLLHADTAIRVNDNWQKPHNICMHQS